MNPTERRVISQAEQELIAGMPVRVQIAKDAQEIKRTFINPNTSNPFPFVDLNARYTQRGATKLYHDGKDERYGLSAIQNEVFVDRALALRQEIHPYGLLDPEMDEEKGFRIINSFDPADPFADVYYGIGTTLELARDYVLIDYSRGKAPDLLVKTIDRLKDWRVFCGKYFQKVKGKSDQFWYHIGDSQKDLFASPFEDIEFPGLDESLGLMYGLLKAIPELAEKELGKSVNAKKLQKIAINSWPFIAHSAMLDHNVFSGLDFVLHVNDSKAFPRPISIEDLVLIKGNNGYRVEPAPHVWEVTKWYLGQFDKSVETKTGGCPAMVFDSIKKIWGWHTDVALDVYKMLSKKPSKRPPTSISN